MATGTAKTTKSMGPAQKKAPVKQDQERKAVQRTRKIMTTVSMVIIAAVVGTASAWSGTRLFMEAGAHWFEAAPLPVTMDLMMITAAFQLRRVGITVTERKWARVSMRFGMITSIMVNTLSAFMHVTGGVIPATWTFRQVILIISAPLLTVVLALQVEMLTHKHSSPAHSAAPAKVTKPAARKVTKPVQAPVPAPIF